MVQIKLSIAFVLAAAAIAPVVSQPIAIGETGESLEAREPHHHHHHRGHHHHHHHHQSMEAPPAPVEWVHIVDNDLLSISNWMI